MSNALRLSQVDQTKAQYNSNRLSILWLTGMTEEEYYRFQFNTGIEWLTTYTGDDEIIIRRVLEQPLIWKWWINEWNRRDAKNLECIYHAYILHKAECMARYRMMHQDIFIRWTPPYTLLEQAYCMAIHDMNKAIQKQQLENIGI